jgi:hypothetical protein
MALSAASFCHQEVRTGVGDMRDSFAESGGVRNILCKNRPDPNGRREYDLTSWRDLERLKEEAQVSISNQVTCLVRPIVVFIRKGTKRIYQSIDDFSGQSNLFA